MWPFRRNRRGGFRGSVIRAVFIGIALIVAAVVGVEAWLTLGDRADRALADTVRVGSGNPWPHDPDPVPPPPRVAPPPRPAPPQAIRREPPPPPPKGGVWGVKSMQLASLHDGRMPNPWPGCSLKAGQYIEALTEDRIESELGGSVYLRVANDVTDADGYNNVLVPQGSLIVAHYKTRGSLNLQRQRLDFAAASILLPDGGQIDLAGAEGADAGGAVGVGGEVTIPWGNIVMTVLLASILDAGQDQTDGGTFANSTADATAGVGRNIAREVFPFEPRILVPGSTLVRVKPQKTIRVC